MATISLRTLTLGDAVNFLLTASPLVVGMMIVPTLAASAGREQPPPWPTLPLTPGTLREHFLLRRGSHWYTAVTHVLCHTDAAHLAGNLSGLLLTGASVHSALGPVGWWLTVGGGALLAAADPAGWRVKQAQSWINAWTHELFPSFTPTLARAWTTHGAWSACGASAAVCAQCGAEAAMCLDQLASLLMAIRDSDGEALGRLMLPAVMHAFLLSRAAEFVLAEHRALAGGAALAAGHGEHLTGFAWGVLCYAVYAVARRRGWSRSWLLRARRRRDDVWPPQARGRRLGGR